MLKTVIADKLYLAPPIMTDEHVRLLKEAQIQAVVNVGGFDNTALLTEGGFHFLVSHFQDTGKDQPALVWEELRTFLLDVLEKGERLAIHCIGGPRRSASTAYLYLRLIGLSDDQAILVLQNVLPDQQPVYSGPINDWLGRRDDVQQPIGGSFWR